MHADIKKGHIIPVFEYFSSPVGTSKFTHKLIMNVIPSLVITDLSIEINPTNKIIRYGNITFNNVALCCYQSASLSPGLIDIVRPNWIGLVALLWLKPGNGVALMLSGIGIWQCAVRVKYAFRIEFSIDGLDVWYGIVVNLTLVQWRLLLLLWQHEKIIIFLCTSSCAIRNYTGQLGLLFRQLSQVQLHQRHILLVYCDSQFL